MWGSEALELTEMERQNSLEEQHVYRTCIASILLWIDFNRYAIISRTFRQILPLIGQVRRR